MAFCMVNYFRPALKVPHGAERTVVIVIGF
jgi:hypothetical protein